MLLIFFYPHGVIFIPPGAMNGADTSSETEKPKDYFQSYEDLEVSIIVLDVLTFSAFGYLCTHFNV